MFNQLEKILSRPKPFEVYSTDVLWTDEHTAKQMMKHHLDPDVDISSRRHSFIENSANWMIERFKLHSGKHVIDFGCGPGLYTQRFARSGAQVTGVDFSSNSLDYARKQAEKEDLSIDYILQSYFEFEGNQKADLITMIFCDFTAMNLAQRSLMLKKFATLLKPGGQVLLDVWSLAGYAHREESTSITHSPDGGFWSTEPYFEFMNILKYDEEKVVLNKAVIIEAERTREVYIWHQYFSKEQLRKEFEAAGLRIHTWLGNVGGAEYDETLDEFAVIAEKME
ncbi:MAG: methyltransferase domain-containing protein [Anaerolineaceae bacterium]|nr:methyltransferase domain-containing protein [Anaerolineaceae bacterium]